MIDRRTKRYAVTGKYASGRKRTMHIRSTSAYTAMRLVEQNQERQGLKFTAYMTQVA